MHRRTLGVTGPTVSAIGLGCMGMSQSYGTPDDAESVATVHRALELGVSFFDTADVYGQGRNEELLGRALMGHRHEIVLATKCGIVAGPNGTMGVDGTSQHIRQACEASLRRLRTDVIDLYYLHRVDPQTPIEESVAALAALVAAGKVRCIGLSEASAGTIQRAHAVHSITAVQSEYSLWWRDPEHTVLPTCDRLGIGFVPFSPLGRGFLTSHRLDLATLPPDDMRHKMPRFLPEQMAHNLRLVRALEETASRLGCTPAQLSLAWLLTKSSHIVPIPGTKRRSYLEENVGAGGVVLTAEDVAELDRIFSEDAVAGARYPEDMMRLLDGGH
ncbi:MAG: aldo/keto reductase [Vicinamibacterales bacterium]